MRGDGRLRSEEAGLRAPVSNGRCRAASCVRRRLDVGVAVRQRCDQCRSGCRRLAGRRPEACRGRAGVAAAAGSISISGRSARGCPSDSTVHVDAKAGVPCVARGGGAVGHAAVCRGVHRSIVFDWNPVDAAWYRAPRADLGRARECAGNDSPRRLQRRDAGRCRSNGRVHCRQLCRLSALPVLCRLLDVLLRSRQFQRDGPSAGLPAHASRLSLRRQSGIRLGASVVVAGTKNGSRWRVLRGRGRRRGGRLEYRRPLRSRQGQLVRDRPGGHGSGRFEA